MAVSDDYKGLQQIKFDLFKTQDPEIGRFDVIFELEGKLLYAHKPMLNLVSHTFDAMLSDRWTSKDEPIKLQNYTYDDFFEFITFLYSAQCNLTPENIVSMVDIAEFYHVELFKSYCDRFLSNMALTSDNIFNFLGFAERYSLTRFRVVVREFVANNFSILGNSEAFLDLSKSDVEQVVIYVKDKVKPEELFEVVYKWAENKMLPHLVDNPLLDQHDAIKLEISDFLPCINFKKMEMDFLIRFVVPRGFIFSSFDELSEILYGNIFKKTKVTVTNARRQIISGNLIPNQTFAEIISTFKKQCAVCVGALCCWWEVECAVPSTPSPIQKNDGVEWYLVLAPNGHIVVSRPEHISDRNYLLAEMKSEEGKDFCITTGCKIETE